MTEGPISDLAPPFNQPVVEACYGVPWQVLNVQVNGHPCTVLRLLHPRHGLLAFVGVDVDDDEKDALRAKIVEFVQALKPRDPVDQCQDATFFRLWLCTQHGPDGADAIDGTPVVQSIGTSTR